MIDWRIKLTSRKFWMAVVAFITPLLLTFGVSENVVSQIVAIIMAGVDVVVYILAEGRADVASIENPIEDVLITSDFLEEYGR